MKRDALSALFAIEVIYEKSLDISTIRGPRVRGMVATGTKLTAVGSEHEIEIAGEGFRPGRSGLAGKMLSHLSQEGLWSIRGRLPEAMWPGFLASDPMLQEVVYELDDVEVVMECEEATVDMTGQPIPVQLAPEREAVCGVLVFGRAGQARLRLLVSTGFQLPDRVQLFLCNMAIWKGVAFEGVNCAT